MLSISLFGSVKERQLRSVYFSNRSVSFRERVDRSPTCKKTKYRGLWKCGALFEFQH